MSNPVDNQQQGTDSPTDIATLQAQLEVARAEAAELRDKYLRASAEMDNVRKQQERRALDRIKQEKKTLFTRLIDVVDDLERALAYQTVAERDALLNSLKLMHTQLSTLLQREGVTSFTSTGDQFDPRLHDAIESVDGSGHPEGHIVQEMQPGYRYNDELLRPARVHVSSGQNETK